MKKALLYSLSLALLLSLAACHKPQADQQEPSQPDPATTSVPADVSTPELIKDTPDPEPPAQPVPEPLAEKITVAPSENEDIQEPAEEVQLFEAVEGGEQTVYVTGTVNIRSIWSIEGEKLGTFNKGQAITRTGTGIEGTEAEGWSQIKVSDGQAEDGTEQFKLVYVSNKYVSVNKVNSQASGGQSQASKPSGGQTGGQHSQSQASKPASKPAGGQQQTQQPDEDEYDASQNSGQLTGGEALKAMQEQLGMVGSDLGRNLTPEEIAAMSESLQLDP